MVYNQPHTIYYKSAKKLLHAGLKMMSPEKVRPLRSVLPYMVDIGRDALGFELEPDMANGAASLGEKNAPGAGATPSTKARLDDKGDDTMEAESSRQGESERKKSKTQT